jgi:hypothetical protein
LKGKLTIRTRGRNGKIWTGKGSNLEKASSRGTYGRARMTQDHSGKRVDQTASLSSLAARKATFLLALIWIASPVAGLRPIRAARLRT